jgi:hypothetical protein
MKSSSSSKLVVPGEGRKIVGRCANIASATSRAIAKRGRPRELAAAMLFIAGGAFAAAPARADDSAPFGPKFIVSCTIPANGDLNPYGVVFVPKDFPSGGKIAPGDVLVANFNNLNNLQGLGVTIIKLTPSSGAVAPLVTPGQNGQATTFFTSNQKGLTTALGILRKGFVIVGNLPSTNGSFHTVSQGSLQVIDRNGNLVKPPLMDAQFFGSPWDLTINDEGSTAQLFVSNVLNGTVVRLDLSVGDNDVAIRSQNVIAQHYAHRGDPVVFEFGPTGLAFDKKAGILYVASTLDNAIYAVTAAGTRTSPVDKGDLVFQDPHLRGPLALAFAPNGDLITTNGDGVNVSATHPSEIVEFTKAGKFVGESNIDSGEGGAFGIAVPAATFYPFIFAAVDDVPNTVTVFNAPGVGFSSTAVADQQ